MRRVVGLSLCALLGTLTIMLSAGEARAFGPFVLRPHAHGHHRGVVPLAPVQPVTPGQIITGIQVAQDVFDAIRARREGADAAREPAVSQEVFDSLDRNKLVLDKAVAGTNALTELVAKNDKRFATKFAKIEHNEGSGGGGGMIAKPKPTKKAPG